VGAATCWPLVVALGGVHRGVIRTASKFEKESHSARHSMEVVRPARLLGAEISSSNFPSRMKLRNRGLAPLVADQSPGDGGCTTSQPRVERQERHTPLADLSRPAVGRVVRLIVASALTAL
jgi:hypothetical protein